MRPRPGPLNANGLCPMTHLVLSGSPSDAEPTPNDTTAHNSPR